MTHTTNFNLSQWAKSDRIQMADFNADNQKIDAALAAVSQCNCRLYDATYTGDGAEAKTLTFPAKPMLIMSLGRNGVTLLIRDAVVGYFIGSKGVQISGGNWADNAVSLSGSAEQIANTQGQPYGLLALLEVG